MPPRTTWDEPRTVVSSDAIMPPVQDSAVAMVRSIALSRAMIS